MSVFLYLLLLAHRQESSEESYGARMVTIECSSQTETGPSAFSNTTLIGGSIVWFTFLLLSHAAKNQEWSHLARGG